ncbi:hypothetical protein [Devosia sp. FKR38]|uniref:hypothetical protein n=1 Tax=Devosia sp. FKR38 TaxID=2562312 RepID=UPI0010C13DE7|nr:hypothetical protein [Devosia sp. FKR38]
MATADRDTSRRAVIAAAITAELARQADAGATGFDIEAIATAVEAALDAPERIDEGKRPNELNATNDD